MNASVDTGRVNYLGVMFVLGVGILFLAIVIQGIGQIELGTHAVAKHNTDAFTARQVIGTYGGPGNRWDCPDGRVRIVVKTVTRWAVMVLEGDVEVTAFMTDSQDYVTRMLEGCENREHYRNAHP
jgi:hypothetical protein